MPTPAKRYLVVMFKARAELGTLQEVAALLSWSCGGRAVVHQFEPHDERFADCYRLDGEGIEDFSRFDPPATAAELEARLIERGIVPEWKHGPMPRLPACV